MGNRKTIRADTQRATGISGTAAAYDLCARPGCADARVKHLDGGPCTAFKWLPPAAGLAANQYGPGTCDCPAFQEGTP